MVKRARFHLPFINLSLIAKGNVSEIQREE